MSESSRSRELALNWLTLPDASPVELIEAASAGDMRWVGLRLTGLTGDPRSAVIGNKPLLRDLDAALRHHGVGLLQMGAVLLDGYQPGQWYEPVLEAGARLGAKYTVAFITTRNPNRRLDEFSLLCDAANRQGMGVAIEFVPYSAIKTVEEAVRLVRQSGRANASILVDVLHLHRSGGSAASLASVAPDLISIAQLCDAPFSAPDTTPGLQNEARRDRLDPGDGDLPLRAFVAALPVNVWLELEIPNLSRTGMPGPQRIRELAAQTRRLLSTF